MDSQMDRAYEMHQKACRRYRVPADPRLAAPFGTPEGMPMHVWIVSWDVCQALYNEAPPPIGPNPKNGDDGTARLFGWRVVMDGETRPGTMRLVKGSVR